MTIDLNLIPWRFDCTLRSIDLDAALDERAKKATWAYELACGCFVAQAVRREVVRFPELVRSMHETTATSGLLGSLRLVCSNDSAIFGGYPRNAAMAIYRPEELIDQQSWGNAVGAFDGSGSPSKARHACQPYIGRTITLRLLDRKESLSRND